MSQKTGGSNDYYSLDVTRTLDGRDAYTVQCLEVIEALGMTFAEGEAFKAIWRSCAARTLGKHKADNHALYDAEKVEFYGKRMVVAATPEQPAHRLRGELGPMRGSWIAFDPAKPLPAPGTLVDVLYEDDRISREQQLGYFSWDYVKAYRRCLLPDCPVGDAPTVAMDVEIPDGKAGVAPTEGWKPWTGGRMPVAPGTLVDTRDADGQEDTSRAGDCMCSDEYWEWTCEFKGDRIVAYRLA